jgi:hypothetical protein
MALPNELSDLNFLLRTSGFFHTLFNTHLYRRALIFLRYDDTYFPILNTPSYCVRP